MNGMFRALAAGCALAAGAAAPGAARADGVIYYYGEPPSLTDTYTAAPRAYYYSEPVVVAPAPRIYYDEEPSYVVRRTTTYYYAPAVDPDLATPPPLGYVPPGLSLQTPIGTYAPLYGGWNPYSSENVGGYNGYRNTNY